MATTSEATNGGSTSAISVRPDLESIDESDWAVAQSRMEAIAPLMRETVRTKNMIEAAAEAAGVHFTTIYQWIALYEESGHLSSLIPRSRGRSKGAKLIDPKLDAIIDSAIQDEYLTRQRRKPSKVIEVVRKRCHAAGIASPHANTIRNRIKALPKPAALRRRGQGDIARNLHEPIRGHFVADFPLAVVQIDHSPADLIIVDDETRQPIGRPWITLAIDVHTRMVVGCHVSLFNPSAYAVGACLAQAMLRKHTVLSSLDVPGDWPVYGKMDIVHADNAREFKGEDLKRICHEYGIELKLRPIKTPHYGGHIERLMGTVANELSNLPGATFSNPSKRKGYDSNREAAFTLHEFEAYLVDWIVNTYHCRPHNGIGMTPLRKMEIGLLGDGVNPGRGLPNLPGDPERLRIDFLPFHECTVQAYGIVLDSMHYWDEVLRPWINTKDSKTGKKQKFIIRRDPRLISPIYFWDPEVKAHYEIPYRDLSRPPTSLWALREARKLLKTEGRKGVDEGALFEAMARLDKRVLDAKTATKSARRQKQARADVKKLQDARQDTGSSQAMPLTGRLPTNQTTESLDDLFSQPIQRHDQIDLQFSSEITRKNGLEDA